MKLRVSAATWQEPTEGNVVSVSVSGTPAAPAVDVHVNQDGATRTKFTHTPARMAADKSANDKGGPRPGQGCRLEGAMGEWGEHL